MLGGILHLASLIAMVLLEFAIAIRTWLDGGLMRATGIQAADGLVLPAVITLLYVGPAAWKSKGVATIGSALPSSMMAASCGRQSLHDH